MGAPPDPPRDGVVERLRVRARNAMGRGEVVDAIAAAIASIAPSRTTSVLVRCPYGGHWQLLGGDLTHFAELSAAFGHARRAVERAWGPHDAGLATYVPLRSHADIEGAAVLVRADDGAALAPVERRLLDEASAVAGEALERIRAVEEADAGERWHAALAAVPRLGLAATEPADAHRLLAAAISSAVPGASATIRLLDRGTGALVPVDRDGPARDRGAERKIAQAAFDLGRLVVESPPALALLPASTRQAAAAPLVDALGRRLGVVSADIPVRGSVRTEHDLRDLAVIADVVSVTLDALRARRAVRVLERIDPDTGCHPPERLYETIDAVLDQARSQGGPTAVMLAQVDRDTEEHDDALERLISTRLASLSTIEPKRVFRLGPWRYAIVVESLPKAGAAQLASRVRLLLRHGLSGTAATCCVGIGMAPRAGDTAQAVLAAAGAALDHARLAGPDHDALRDSPAPEATLVNAETSRAAADRRRALRLLAGAVEERHFGGSPHADAVAGRVRALCNTLRIDPRTTTATVLAGELHDVGRAVVPHALFARRGLSPQELTAVLNHVVLGARLLDTCGFSESAEIVRCMHERWDGTGFPGTLAGTAIPIGSRILAVANAFETVLNDLGQGDGGIGSAVATVRARRGSAFDPSVVDALLAQLGRGGRKATPTAS